MREFEHITLARVLLARRSTADALALLGRLLNAAEAGERAGSTIEILVLQALGQQMFGHMSAALESLEQAMILAEPEAYVRTFVDEGPPMATLLETAAKQRMLPEYVHLLKAVFGKNDRRAPVKRGSIEPLSERELDVLRLLGTDLDGPDIARELTVSLNTMRTHTKSIYAKLGVSNRRAAVRRAEELELLAQTRQH
jgi:LuxR family transcriptional regulator, maltose regulon positive regulatory protein